MSHEFNECGLPVGSIVPGWNPRPWPLATSIQGRYCRLAPLVAADHAQSLWLNLCEPSHPGQWTYMPDHQPADAQACETWVVSLAASRDPMFHAVIDEETRRAMGLVAFMRVDCANGVIEVGHIHYGPALQRTRAGTEAIYLAMRRAFDELGFRRLEWKCDSLNAPSRRAAERFGFTFEGVFRNAKIVKGRNRDTAWYAIIDREWPAIKVAFDAWLDPGNFDAQGRQIVPLSGLRLW
jgi:RimJ/RimL family protein N-acetyltransferase